MFTALILVCLGTNVNDCKDYFGPATWYSDYDVCMAETATETYRRYELSKEEGTPDPDILAFECFKWEQLNGYNEENDEQL